MNTFTATLWTVILALMQVKIYGAPDLCTSRLEPGAVMCQVDTNAVFKLRDIDVSLCTHVLIVINGAVSENGTLSTEEIVGSYFNDDADLSVLARLKAHNIRVGIKIGTLKTFGPVARRFVIAELYSDFRKGFVDSLLSFMRKYELSIVEITITNFQKKFMFANLIEEISRATRPRGWLIGVAAYGLPDMPFDPVDIAKNVDYVNVEGYVYTVLKEHVGPNAPIESIDPMDNLTVKYSLERIVSLVGANCVVLTIPMFGIQWAFPDKTDEPGPGSFLDHRYGFAAKTYTEVCLRNYRGECHRFGTWDNVSRTPWAVCGGYFFITYDNAQSIGEKVDLALTLGIRGVSAFTINQDDYRNACEGGRYPLLHAAQKMRRTGSS